MEYLRPFGKGIYTFGTWNVQGLNDPQKTREVVNEIDRENVHIAVLTETKLRGYGQEEHEKYIHHYCGVDTGYARAGVSIVVKKDFRPILDVFLINERIITAEFKIDGQHFAIIGVYWVNDTDAKDVKSRFEDSFKKVLAGFKNTHELIILGDFNCKVGTSTSTTSKVVGNFGVKDINTNGRRLIDICEEFGLKIQNTFFDHEDIHKYTWYHKRNSSRSLIDYCITRQETTLHVHDVLACRWLECGSDHIFVAASISFPTKQLPTSKTSESREYVLKEDILEMRKYKTYLLYSKTFRDSYNGYLDSVINISTERSTDEMYNHLKESIHSAAYDVLGIQDKDMFGELFWDKEIKDLRAKRRLPYRTTFDSHFGKIQNEVWEGVCLAIDNMKRNKRSKGAISILEQMLNRGIENLEFRRIGISEKLDYVSEWKATKEFTINPLQINVSDVNKALYELEDDSIGPVPGGISIQLLRNSSDIAKSLLTDLIQDIFSGKEMPPEIRETYDLNYSTSEIGVDPLIAIHCIMRVMCFILKEKLEKEICENTLILPQLNPLDATFTQKFRFQKNAEEYCHFACIDLKEMYFNFQYSKLFRILSEKYKISETLLVVLERLILLNTITIEDRDRNQIPFGGLVEKCNLGPALFKLYIQVSIEQHINDHAIEASRCLHVIANNKLIIVSTNFLFLVEMVDILPARLGNNLYLDRGIQRFKYLGNRAFEWKDHREFSYFGILGKSVIDFDGSLLELDGSSWKEVFHRIIETKNIIAILHPVVRDKNISTVNKNRIFNTIISCILMEGCETWTLTRDLEKYINLLESYYWKWCNPCNKLLSNLMLRKTTYNIEIKKILKCYPENARRKGQNWADDIDEI